MIVGNPSIFAIESDITVAYSRLSFRALGYFVLSINGHKYGVQRPDATMLACSFDEVERRIVSRGMHTAPSWEKHSPREIAESFRRYNCLGDTDNKESKNQEPIAYSNPIVWAPDGDAAFDDSSYVLQFDMGDHVRLIAFQAQHDRLLDLDSLNEVFLKSEDFYTILKQWHDRFLAEWTSLPKNPD